MIKMNESTLICAVVLICLARGIAAGPNVHLKRSSFSGFIQGHTETVDKRGTYFNMSFIFTAWVSSSREDILPEQQSLQEPDNQRRDEDSILFNSYGLFDPQLIQYSCICIDLQSCPAAISVFKNKPPLKTELDLIRLFTCGYEGFKPLICCNLFVESVIIRRHRKQKRAHFSYGGYGSYNRNRHPQSNVRDKTKHHFFWDGSSFPHWSHAPNDADNYNGHDCWTPHEHEGRGYDRPTARPATQTMPPVVETTTDIVTTLPATAPMTTPPTAPEATTTPEVPTIVPEAPPTTVLPESTTMLLTGKEAKRTLLNEQNCGTKIESRIVGGEDAKLGDYPWMARLGYRRNSEPSILFRCGGTLINDRYVLTAAHCTTNLPIGLQLVTIRLGELDERTALDCAGTDCADPPKDYVPTNLTVHPSYNNPRLSNDIALILLAEQVEFSYYISPLCLPFDGSGESVQRDLAGVLATVAGWGSTNTGTGRSNGSPTLKWVRLLVIPTNQCITTYKTRFDITVSDQQICTGGVENMDACEGDSGGPLFLESDGRRRATLIGIVSFGPRRCGTAALPGVYTRVHSYLDWILDSINI